MTAIEYLHRHDHPVWTKLAMVWNDVKNQHCFPDFVAPTEDEPFAKARFDHSSPGDKEKKLAAGMTLVRERFVHSSESFDRLAIPHKFDKTLSEVVLNPVMLQELQDIQPNAVYDETTFDAIMGAMKQFSGVHLACGDFMPHNIGFRRLSLGRDQTRQLIRGRFAVMYDMKHVYSCPLNPKTTPTSLCWLWCTTATLQSTMDEYERQDVDLVSRPLYGQFRDTMQQKLEYYRQILQDWVTQWLQHHHLLLRRQSSIIHPKDLTSKDVITYKELMSKLHLRETS